METRVELVYWDPMVDLIALPKGKRLCFDYQWQAEAYLEMACPQLPLSNLKWKILKGTREMTDKDVRLVPLSKLT